MRRLVAAAFLEKLARHLLILVCLAILSKAAGWIDPSQASILLLCILATVVHWCGRMTSGLRRDDVSR